MALEAELALTLNVLEAMANSSLDHILDQPLHTLHHIHSKLQACVSARGTRAVSGLWPPVRPPLSQALPHTLNTTLLCPQVPAQPTAGPRPRGRLHHWLHRLQDAPKKVSDRGGETDGWAQLGAQTWELLSHPPLPPGVPGLPRSLCHVQPLPAPHPGPEMCCQWRPVCLTPETHLQRVSASSILFMRQNPFF